MVVGVVAHHSASHVKHPFPNRNSVDGDITCHDIPLLLLGDNRQLAHGQHLVELDQCIYFPLFLIITDEILD